MTDRKKLMEALDEFAKEAKTYDEACASMRHQQLCVESSSSRLTTKRQKVEAMMTEERMGDLPAEKAVEFFNSAQEYKNGKAWK